MRFDPAMEIQDYLVFGEYGDVNPSITDSSTYTFLSARTMEELFDHPIEGCYLYSRHVNPTDAYLARALARMEGAEAAQVMSSGMAAISTTLLQLCSAGDHIVAEHSIYGGTYALLKNVLPRFGIDVTFVDMADLDAVRGAVRPRTRVIFCEGLSNPLLTVADLPSLGNLAETIGAQLVVDNTFSPMILSPLRLGAHVVIHSLTKFINGTSDCVAGCVVGDRSFISALNDVNSGTSMLLGPTLDPLRAASILKNMHTLHLRLKKHGENALMLARRLHELGVRVHYPGLPQHPQHELLNAMRNPDFGYGGIVTVDVGTKAMAERLMMLMQDRRVGYLAVSLGYFKTLFSAPGHSTSSEIPEDERATLGVSDGLVRISVGLDHDMGRSVKIIEECLLDLGLLHVRYLPVAA